ncbi:hypothetical protein [Endozoicomonas lisbonensis]
MEKNRHLTEENQKKLKPHNKANKLQQKQEEKGSKKRVPEGTTIPTSQ